MPFIVGDRLEEKLLTWWARDHDPVPQWDSWLLPHRATLPNAVLGVSATSLYEIGCGAGPNLRLLREHFPGLRLSGSDLNQGHATWASLSLSIPIEVRPLPHPVDASWDATLSCYVMAYCAEPIVAQQLASIESPYLILMEPWGQGECFQMGAESCPRFYHDWRRLAGDAGWRLEWRWPLAPIDSLTSLSIFQKHRG